jgi:pimeloyl-ACP methyl ester carboxylesterase
MPTVASHFIALLSDAPRLHEIARLPMRMQILVGAQTRSPTRSIGDRLAELTPHFSVRWLPGLGHMGPLTHPEVVNPIVTQFLDMEQGSERPLERLAA